MGKSTAANLLAEMQVAVVDTDLIARDVVEPGQPALDEIVSVFGKEVIDPDGRLMRDALARRVFENTDARRQLEAILHPRIRKAWIAQTERWENQERPLGAVVIPLLFETEAADHFDATICVACSPRTQKERLRLRGWSDAQIEQRIQAQWPVEKKMRAADYVVWTEGSLETHADQLRRVLQALSR